MPTTPTLRSLPPDISAITSSLVQGLQAILAAELYGIYLYGALLFPDAGPAQDVDCHVVLRRPLTTPQRAAIKALHRQIASRFPPLGAELDAYYVLLDAAQGHTAPQHQLNPAIFDHAWALHCAHVRRGYYQTLFGPAPDEIFPTPNWEALEAALKHELQYVRDHLQYPAYCALNLCRILYSFTTQDVVVSKQFSGRWALKLYPGWAQLLHAALRFYDQATQPGDDEVLHSQIKSFLGFIEEKLLADRP